MRPKSFLLFFALLQHALVSHGLVLQPGWNFVVNQVNAFGGNSVMNVLAGLPNPPLGSPFQVVKWSGPLQTWQPSAFYNNGGTWSGNLAMTLNPGAGAVVFSPMPGPVTVTISGTSVTPLLPLGLTAGFYYLIGSQSLVPGTWNTIVGTAEQSGDEVFRYSAGTYSPYAYDVDLGGWVPFNPQTATEESAWVLSMNGTIGNPPPAIAPPWPFKPGGVEAGNPPALAPPIMVAGPIATLTVTRGESLTLTVVTANYASDFQWYHLGLPRMDATNATLTVSAIQPADAGTYWVVVSNPFGSVTSTVSSVTVVPATVVFAGVTNHALGVASLNVTNDPGAPARLAVGNLGASGQDGVSMEVGAATRFQVDLAPINSQGQLPIGARLLTRAIGSTNGGIDQALDLMTFSQAIRIVVVSADFSALGTTSISVRVLRQSVLLAEFPASTGILMHASSWPSAVGRLSGPSVTRTILYPIGTVVTVGGESWQADELRLETLDQAGEVDHVARFEITAKQINEFSVTDVLLNQPVETHLVLFIRPLSLGGLEVRWAGSAFLQNALSLGGAWSDVPGAISPYQVVATSDARFFRLRQP